MKSRRQKKRGTRVENVLRILEEQEGAIVLTLMKRLRISGQEAIDLVHTTLAQLFLRYRHCDWPSHIRRWGAYLITCALHAYLEAAISNKKFLVFASPIED